MQIAGPVAAIPAIGSSGGAAAHPSELSADEQRQLDALQRRDREVRAHEAAHLAAAGNYARGGAQLNYRRGPDGRLYAVGGEVAIDNSAVPGDPEGTLKKAETVLRAALAPADPSPQDRQVAAEAAAMAARARLEMQQEESGGAAVSDPETATRRLVARIDNSGARVSGASEQAQPLHLIA